ncbi:MAG: hypothetical protein RLZZ182_442 [Pseudomonadota bacterium]
MQLTFVQRAVRVSMAAGLVCAMAGCANAPRGAAAQAEPVTVAGQVVPDRIASTIAAADKAQKEGRTERALDILDDAARLEPASKMPWLRRAQIHFEARQYGAAIQAAQEALQRDASDLTAKSILAVSGLRVSADALDQLRKVNEVNGSARAEAESVARLIREALGEPILVEAPAAGPAKPEVKPLARPVARPAARPTGPAAPQAPAANSPAPTAAKPVTPVVPTAAAKSAATTAPAKAANPFGSLK